MKGTIPHEDHRQRNPYITVVVVAAIVVLSAATATGTTFAVVIAIVICNVDGPYHHHSAQDTAIAKHLPYDRSCCRKNSYHTVTVLVASVTVVLTVLILIDTAATVPAFAGITTVVNTTIVIVSTPMHNCLDCRTKL